MEKRRQKEFLTTKECLNCKKSSQQLPSEALNHVDNVDSITSNVRFDFVGFTRKVESKELKHQTFLIQERHGWPHRTGSGTRFTRQMQIIKQTNVKPSRTPTE